MIQLLSPMQLGDRCPGAIFIYSFIYSFMHSFIRSFIISFAIRSLSITALKASSVPTLFIPVPSDLIRMTIPRRGETGTHASVRPAAADIRSPTPPSAPGVWESALLTAFHIRSYKGLEYCYFSSHPVLSRLPEVLPRE